MGKLAIIVVCVVAAAIVAVRLSSRSATDQHGERQSHERDALVRITPHRIPLATNIAALCRAPAPDYGPHAGAAEVHIYANQTALDYRRDHPNEFDYPIGSRFVKEKYSSTGDENPDVATIMERRIANGDVSDWDFSIVSLPDKTALKPTSRVTCAECHQDYKDTGYVSSDSEALLREYLKIE